MQSIKKVLKVEILPPHREKEVWKDLLGQRAKRATR